MGDGSQKTVVNVKPFIGLHCETTATGTLLRQLGIELSEPMLFGLGEGLEHQGQLVQPSHAHAFVLMPVQLCRRGRLARKMAASTGGPCKRR